MNGGLHSPDTGGKGEVGVVRSWHVKLAATLTVTYPDAGARPVSGLGLTIDIPEAGDYYVQYAAHMTKNGGVNNYMKLDGFDIPGLRMLENFASPAAATCLASGYATLTAGRHTFQLWDQAAGNLNSMDYKAGASILIYKLPMLL